MGPQKVVVLAGYKTVKEALVNYAEEFGEREPITTVKEAKQDYGTDTTIKHKVLHFAARYLK